jgi:hypothetical protein
MGVHPGIALTRVDRVAQHSAHELDHVPPDLRRQRLEHWPYRVWVKKALLLALYTLRWLAASVHRHLP